MSTDQTQWEIIRLFWQTVSVLIKKQRRESNRPPPPPQKKVSTLNLIVPKNDLKIHGKPNKYLEAELRIKSDFDTETATSPYIKFLMLIMIFILKHFLQVVFFLQDLAHFSEVSQFPPHSFLRASLLFYQHFRDEIPQLSYTVFLLILLWWIPCEMKKERLFSFTTAWVAEEVEYRKSLHCWGILNTISNTLTNTTVATWNIICIL